MSLKQKNREPYLKVVNKNISKTKNTFKAQLNRIYINTLTPKFSYKNHKGELIITSKCALL